MSQSMKKQFPSLTSIDIQSDGNTSFLRAARNGQLDKVLEHLKQNIDINTSNANGLNALHLASKDGHVDIVEELLKRGAVVDAATKKGNTALHIASLAGQEEVVKILVQHGASVNVQSQNGFTPLYMAAQENHDNVVRYLLANGANQSLSTEDGFTPLAVAMQQGHDKVVTVLLENDTRGKVRLPALHIAAKKDDVKAAKLLLENEHNPDVTSKSGFTPLHIAAHYGNTQVGGLLLQRGADVNCAAKHAITPLHVAAKWGKAGMAGLLLERGATIEARTRDGLTPLHCAARSGHEQVVDMLLERGAPITAKTKNGLAPLHMAAQGDHVDAARILLYHRAPVDDVTVDYLTALHVAAHCGHARVAKLLLDRQADANARALNGFTPLHIACKKNRIKVVELLLKHGASIGATTESGLTPLHVASFMGAMNIVIYLLQHDANPDAPTIRGETPLHLAARANQTDIIRILLRNGAQVDARAREQQTPLHIASRLGNVDIVMLLLQHGAKVDNATKDMYTALHIAAKEGQDEVAASLIDNGASINATTKKGFTPLHLASKYGHLKVAELLLQKGAPVDAQGKNGVTPLHVASHYDHQNVALLLLDKGASPHATAKNGHTPLHIAARKNQMDIANTLLEYGAQPNAESKAGFTPLHLSAQEGHDLMSGLLIENKANPDHQAKNGLTPLHLCAQEDRVPVAEILVKNGAEVNSATKAGYTPLHIACHYGQTNMVKFLLQNGAKVGSTTALGYTPLHQAAQQGHANIVNILLENKADPNAETANGQTPLNIAQKLGYITVIETLKVVTTVTTITTTTTTNIEEKYKVQAPELMHETFMSDSEEEGGEDTVLVDQTYRYLTADEMKSLGDDSLPIDVTRDERIDSNKMVASIESNMLPPQHIEDSISPEHVSRNYVEYIKKYTPDNIDISRHPINVGFLVSFLVDARGGAMRGCRHSGVRVIVPPRCAPSPTRITCRYVRPQRTPHPPPLMEGEALASRVLELGPVGAKFLGPVIIEVPHFAALRGKEREIVILRSDNGESWKEHTVDATEEVLNDVLQDNFEAEDLNQMEDLSSGRITRIVTQDFPQYFAVVSRIRQEVHAIGPEGGMVSSTVVPQVQAIFPEGALTKKIKVGLQAQPIDPELTAKLLGHGVAVSPVVTVEPRRRKFHKAIRLNMPAPTAHSQGMINQYSGSAPTLRLLCSITGGTTRAQWEDVTGSTPLTFVNDVVSFTTTVSARFWLMDCRNIGDATKMATELYKEAIHVPFMAKFVVFAKRVDPLEARLRVFCMTDDKEDKTLEHQEHFTEVAKSRDVEVLEGKLQHVEFAGNLVPVTKSGEQPAFAFRAFRENRLPFSVRVKDQHAEAVGRCLFMRESRVPKGEPPQQPICILNIVLPDDIVTDTISLTDSDSIKNKIFLTDLDYSRPDPRIADMSNLLGDDWVELAHQLGLTTSEINVIKSEYPESVAKQAQSMLRMWLSQSGNKAQTNTLENALRRIGREDIIPQCLNVDHAGQITRIKQEETGYRLTPKEIIVREEIRSKEEEIRSKVKDKIYEHYDKYSAEEKVVEKSESEEEETFEKPVAERREKIEKRLSAERTIPASTQRKEIVQEISDIKRQSLVEDKIQEVQQKIEDIPSESKTTVTKTVTSTTPEGKTVSETIETKTTPPSDSKVSRTVEEKVTKITETRTTQKEMETTHKTVEDAELLEKVTRRFEDDKKVVVTVSPDEVPKTPKYSKTPPPSPADFLIKDQATKVSEWDARRKAAESDKGPAVAQEAAQQESSYGLTTEAPLTPAETKIPQPKPRTVKTPDMPLQFDDSDNKPDKVVSPVRDDLLDEEDGFRSYSDKKKFWEDVTTHKRMSLHETTIEKEVVAKKRMSVHEFSQPSQAPVPKPRSILQATQSLIESESEGRDRLGHILKSRTISFDSTTSESTDKQLTSLSKLSESEASLPDEKIMSEYQASFTPPAVHKEKLKTTGKSEDSADLEKEDSLDSDKAQKGSSQFIENTGYISDSEDVENVISDSEIEDRVPQIRERQMSVFAPPVPSQRKMLYERSASLPTEDLYEVSARSIKLRKEYYEQQIKKEMIEEQFGAENEEESSPERKTLTTLQEEKIMELLKRDKSEDTEDEISDKLEESDSKQSVRSLTKSFEDKTRTETKLPQETSIEKKMEHIEKIHTDEKIDNEETDLVVVSSEKKSVKDLAKGYEKQLGDVIAGQKIGQSPIELKGFTLDKQIIDESKSPELTESEDSVFDSQTHKSDTATHKSEEKISVSPSLTHKETDTDGQQKTFESQQSIASDITDEQILKDDSLVSKPDSMEVHVDKSEIEDSEKITEFDAETDYEVKSLDSLNAEISPKLTQFGEEIPEITVTLSGTQRRISEESDEYSDKADKVVEKSISPVQEQEFEPDIKQPQESIQDTVWEVSVESHHGQFEEKVEELSSHTEMQATVAEQKDVVDITSTKQVTEAFLAEEKSRKEKQEPAGVFEQKKEAETSQIERIVHIESQVDLKRVSGETQSDEEDMASQMESFVRRESIHEAQKPKESTKLEKISVKENISEQLTKEITEKLAEKIKEENLAIEKAVTEEVDDTTYDELKEIMVEEAMEELKQSKSHEKLEISKDVKDEDFSSSFKEESDFGSEVLQDHTFSDASDKIKSESQSDIEKIILDSLHQQKVEPEEAKKIASALIEEIEAEIQKRESVPSEPKPEKVVIRSEVSEYLRHLAETKGLDELEVELVESVLARRQRELAKLARGDTQASSMEITDEDLRYSGADIDYTHTLEQQIGQLEAERVHKLDLEYIQQEQAKHFQEHSEGVEKIDEKHLDEKKSSYDSQNIIDSKLISVKKDSTVKTSDAISGEKSQSEQREVTIGDEIISKTFIEKQSEKIGTDISVLKEDLSEIRTEGSLSISKAVGSVDASVGHKTEVQKEEIELTDKYSEKILSTTRAFDEEKAIISGAFKEHQIEVESTPGMQKEIKSDTEKQYGEVSKKQEECLQKHASELKIQEDGSQIETTTSIDKKHVVTSTSITTKDKVHEESSTVLQKVIEDKDIDTFIDSSKLKELKSETGQVTVVTKEVVKRTSSSESKSSLESAKSPEDPLSSESSRGKDSDGFKSTGKVILRKIKPETDTSSSSSNLKPDRKSGVDFEAYSSSGESHYQSFEIDSGKSRPCSSDVEGLMAVTGSSEYESVLTSQEYSARSHATEYQTAVSSLSSKESMKSLDSESSGNLASIEVSEHSETLVPSTSDIDADMIDSMDQHILDDIETSSGWTAPGAPIRQSTEVSDSELFSKVEGSLDISEEDGDAKQGIDIQSKMKRSHEMTFQPEPQVLMPDSPQDKEEKYATSLDDGSILSMSVSSTSSAGAQRTVIELSRADSERLEGSMTVSGTSEHVSLEDVENIMRGSRESLGPVSQITTDMSTSTATAQELPIESVTLTTSTVEENGISSVSTQVTSEMQSKVVPGASTDKGEEPKRKGHRRTDSTSTFLPSMIGISSSARAEVERKLHSDLAESDKYITDLSMKEASTCDEKKDVDESEKDLCYETEADQGFQKDVRDGRYLDTESDNDADVQEMSRPQSQFSKSDSDKDRPTSTALSDDRMDSELVDLIKSSDITDETDPIERPTSPEPCDEIFEAPPSSTEVDRELSGQMSPRPKDVNIPERKRSMTSIADITPQRDMLEKRDSHGRSSSTSSEKSSFEEAEAEAAFSMVAHVSPAHKIKQIIPILEDEDAEKQELEIKEKAEREREERRAAHMRDMSPGFIPDIKVTQHMTPLVDRHFRYPDLEAEKFKGMDEQDDKIEEKEEDGEVAKVEQRTKTPKEQEVVIDTSQTPSSKSSEESDQGREYVLDESVSTIPEESEEDGSKPSQMITESAITESKSTVVDKAVTDESGRETDSPSSDSFEMLEKPDIIDDFVVIEEVAKEAQEFDTEGKSVQITKKVKVKKHDEEVEAMLVHSAPTPLTKMTDVKYYPSGSSSEELGFEFEDSPPQLVEQRDAGASTTSIKEQGYEYDKELEANRKWIEQQFQGDQAAMMAAGYGYEMEFERGPLEDIKEEDINDFAASSYGSQKDSGGSLGSVKESYSSTPEYDVLAGRKYFTRSGEHDDVSMSSLQEFESLEKAMSLEMRKFHTGSHDSSSNGSFKTRYIVSKTAQGDDISVSSLKEFEGLEKACIAAHRIEVKVKEEEASLTHIDEGHEGSVASESESMETVSEKKLVTDTDDEEDYEKRMFEIDEIIRQAQSNVERFVDLKEMEKTESLGRGDSVEEVSKVPDLELDAPVVKSTIKVQWKESDNVLVGSTDSLDLQDDKERRDSTDSLDKPPPCGDIMSASTDSIEFQAAQKAKDIMTDSIEMREDKSYMVSSDSLELGQATSFGVNVIQSDSIDEDGSRIGGQDQSTSSTGKDFSSSAKDELVEQKADFMLESTDSIDVTSSTATHATYQFESDSVFSGSFTSGGSNTMVSSTETIDPMHTREMIDVAAAARKVWFDEGASGSRISEYIEDASKPYVTEVIEPCEDEFYSHTIHRKVELPAEVRKVTFTGPDAEEQMRKYIQQFREGEDVEESEEMDEAGNVHVRKVVQKRVIVKGGDEQPMSKQDIEEYFRQMQQPELAQGQRRAIVQGQGVITRTVTDGGERTTITQRFDLPSSELTTLTKSVAGGEASSSQAASRSSQAETEETKDKESQPDRSTPKVADLHQLSDEMKEYLKELERESKQ